MNTGGANLAGAGLLRVALRLVQAVVVLYIFILLAIYFLQPRLLYRPSAVITKTPAVVSLAFEDVAFRAAGGRALFGWYVRAPVPASTRPLGVVLFFHGNSENISRRVDMLAVFARMGFDTFIFDYAGYGRSEGRPSESATYEDGRAAWSYLVKTRGVEPGRIVLYGHSLGGGVASRMATEVEAAGLVLDSTFTSYPAIAGEVFPFVPTRLVARYDYDTLGNLKRVDEPVLVVHSRDDELIDIEHGRRLYDAARSERKAFVETTGAHDNGSAGSGARYFEPVRSFLASITG